MLVVLIRLLPSALRLYRLSTSIKKLASDRHRRRTVTALGNERRYLIYNGEFSVLIICAMKTYSRKKPGECQEVILHLNELCRLCMSKENELVPIFDESEAVPLTLRIMACVALEVRTISLPHGLETFLHLWFEG